MRTDERPALPRNLQVGLTVVCVALTSAGCAANPGASRAPSTPSIQPSSAPSPSAQESGGPVWAGTISISGQYSITGSFSTRAELVNGGSITTPPASETCAEYADGLAQHLTSFAAPVVQTAGERTIYLEATIASGYHGPGSYTNRLTPTLSGSVQVAIGDLAQGGFVDVFRSDMQATTTLTVRSDGSGTLDFSGWSSGDSSLSGTLTWMCRS